MELNLLKKPSTSSLHKVRVGARASKLSQAQVQEAYEALKKEHPALEFIPTWVQTTGDKDLRTSLRTLEKTDFFTKEIDALLLQGAIDIAIHSAKDLPDPLPAGLCLAALLKGLDPSDSLVLREGETLASLPHGALIGTSSKRREEVLKQMRADFVCVDIRGAIEQRLKKLDQKKVDGVVVAECALLRLGLHKRNRIQLPGDTAPLQGQLAIVARKGSRFEDALSGH
jgi:hydroxymethylbilane synthase